MKYINKIFSVEKVKTQDLAKKLGTPLYCYTYEKLKININKFVAKKNYKQNKFHLKIIESHIICYEETFINSNF